MPDFLVFAGLPLRTAGVPVILDFHEAMPVFFPTRFPRAASPVARRALGLQERLSIRAASHVLIVNEALRDRLVGTGRAAGQDHGRPEQPVPGPLRPGDRAAPGRSWRTASCGSSTRAPSRRSTSSTWRSTRSRGSAPSAPRWTSGSRSTAGATASRLSRSASRAAGLAERVTFRGRIPFEEVPGVLAAADIGLAPTRLDELHPLQPLDQALRVRGDGQAGRRDRGCRSWSASSATDTVRTYEPGDAEDLARAILRPRGRPGPPGAPRDADGGADRRAVLGARGAALPRHRRVARPGRAILRLGCSARRRHRAMPFVTDQEDA